MALRDAVVKQIFELREQGLPQGEIVYRTGLSKGVINDVLHHRYGVGEKRAADVARNLAEMVENFTAYAPSESGRIVEVDPINKSERTKLRDYLEAVDAFKRGGPTKLDRLKTKYVWVRGKQGKEKFYLNKDKASLREMARSGELREVKYWRGRGTP